MQEVHVEELVQSRQLVRDWQGWQREMTLTKKEGLQAEQVMMFGQVVQLEIKVEQG